MDVHRLLDDICQVLDPIKRNGLRTLVQEPTAQKAAREIPSVTKALVERAPAVVGADLWHACCEKQRREVPAPPDQPAAAVRGAWVGVAREGHPQPRGRPPKGASWDAARGEWVRVARKGRSQPRGRPAKGASWDAARGKWIHASDDPWRCNWCGTGQTRGRRKGPKGPGTLCGPCGVRFSNGKTGPLSSATFECRWCKATATHTRWDGPTGEGELCGSCGQFYAHASDKVKARLVRVEKELVRLTSVLAIDVDAGKETRIPRPKRSSEAPGGGALKALKTVTDATAGKFAEIKSENAALEGQRDRNDATAAAASAAAATANAAAATANDDAEEAQDTLGYQVRFTDALQTKIDELHALASQVDPVAADAIKNRQAT